MSEQEENRKSGGLISFDLNKWLPYLLIGLGWVLSYGRTSNSNDMLRVQVESQQSTIQDLTKQLAAQSERIVRVETRIDSDEAAKQQEERFHTSTTPKDGH